MPRQKKNSSEKHTGKFFVPGVRNSRCPPPAKPTNKPVSLGDKSDEEIIDNTSYEFSIDIETLLNNSTTTRRSQANPDKPPRPQNAFMLYRRDKFAKYTKENEGTKFKQSKFSQEISPMWINESPEVKELFNALSRVSEKLHMKTHGESYRYLPRQKRQNGRKKNYDTSSTHSYSDTDIGSPNSINIPGSPASDTSYTSSDFYNQDNLIASNCVIDFSNFGNNNFNNILSYANYNVIPPVTPVTSVLPVTPVLHVPDFNEQEFGRIFFLAYNMYMDLKSKNSMNEAVPDFDDQEFCRIFLTAYHMYMAKNSMNEVVSDTPPEFSEELFNEYVNF